MNGERETVIRYGAWEGCVWRCDVRAFDTTLWGWEFAHDGAGTFGSGFRRTREQAIESIGSAFDRYAGPRHFER